MSINSSSNFNKRNTSERSITDTASSFLDVNVPLNFEVANTFDNLTSCGLPEKVRKVEVDRQRGQQNYYPITSNSESEEENLEDVGEIFPGQLGQPNDSDDERCGTSPCVDDAEQELDSMWFEVCENLLAETEERDLRDWEEPSTGEEDGDFFDVVEDLTFTESDHMGKETDGADAIPSEELHNVQKENISREKQPLYPGAKVTIGAVMVLLSLFTIRYDITGEALAHLLKLLTLMLPCGHILPNSLRNFKKFFNNLQTPFILHYYCAFCLTYVNKNEKKCPNPGCSKELSCQQAKAYFIEFPVVRQLRTFFLRDGFYDDIQHRFNRKKKSENNIEDIYDGALYKQLSRKGILSSPDNVSFVLNTDGVPVFKSSKLSIWPLYFIVNELPYAQRMSRENMIFAGLWFSEKKPAMWTFLKPHTESLQTLENGVEMQSPTRGKFLCKGILLACSCDLPARCLLCNSMQFNGENGCWKCLQPGQTVRTGVRGDSRAFLYQTDNPKGPLRTTDSVKQDAEKAVGRANQGVARYMVNGVKGPSWLSLLEHFDLVRGVAIDYMHGVLLGVQKLLLTLWFSSKFSKSNFSISSKVEQVDARLRQISPTSEIKRLPRSIEDHLKYWKASELRSFLLYYGLPILYGVLPDNYFNHYTLFVQAIFILLKDSISQAELKEAERLLDSFCKSFAVLYEERFYTLNLHQLLHLVDDVRDLGPLYTHSCFTFEDKNGFILKLIHGTQYIDKQILSAVSLTQKMPELRQKCLPKGSEMESLYLDLTRSSKSKFRTKILPDVYAISATYQVLLSVTEVNALEMYIGSACPTDRLWAFNRLELSASDSVICGLAYKRMRKRNCAVIKYNTNDTWGFAIVRYFIKYDLSSSQPIYLAVAHPILCIGYNPKLHINRVVPYNDEEIILINITSIWTNCLYIALNEEPASAYICEFPNKNHECD